MRVYKYDLEVVSKQTISMPLSAKIIHVGLQFYDEIYLWAIVDPTNVPENRTFYIVGTGDDLPTSEHDFKTLVHLGTVITSDNFVWHVFEFQLIQGDN